MDLTSLEQMFLSEGVDQGQIDRIRSENGLGYFVRSLIGLDREAAKKAFGDFQIGRALTANQMEFLNLIIDHLSERGVIDPQVLYSSPYTDFDPMGVEGVFGAAGAAEVIAIVEGVKRRTAA